MFEKGMNENLITNDKGMRVHANTRAPIVGDAQNRPPFGGTYAQSLVPNPQNSKHTAKSISHKSDYKKRMKSAEQLDELRG